MSLEDCLWGCGSNGESPDFPDRFYSIKWLCDNHPIYYMEKLMHQGYDRDHIMKQVQEYEVHYYRIAYEALK